MTVVVNTK